MWCCDVRVVEASVKAVGGSGAMVEFSSIQGRTNVMSHSFFPVVSIVGELSSQIGRCAMK